MTTAREIITDALRKISVLGIGQSLNADEANHALLSLNDFLSFVSLDIPMIFTDTKETFNLTGAQSYSIGSGGDFNTTIPKEIRSVFMTIGTTDYPINMINENQYADISNKAIEGDISDCYYSYGYPLARLYVYPVQSIGTITLYSRKELTSFVNLDAVMNMPSEYRSMLVHNLAVWIAPEYEREALPTIKEIATESKNKIINQNTRQNKRKTKTLFPDSSVSDYDINRGF